MNNLQDQKNSKATLMPPNSLIEQIRTQTQPYCYPCYVVLIFQETAEEKNAYNVNLKIEFKEMQSDA